MITQEQLKELFDYRDGCLFWKVRKSYNTIIGSRAGCYSKIHHRRFLRIDDRLCKEHIIIWVWHYGAIPEGMEIDHRDTDSNNNRIENLRLATHSQNGKNLKVERKNNTTGYKGVGRHHKNKKWIAAIRVDYNKIHIGCYKTKEEAAMAYNAEAIRRFGEFANLNIIK